MKPAVKYALMGVGGVALLFGSFVTFAALSGTPLHEVAIIKNFVKAPAPGEEHAPGDATKTAEKPADPGEHASETAASAKGEHEAKSTGKPDAKAVEASVGVLGAFSLPAPFSADELGDLQRELREARSGAKERLAKIEEREHALDDYERALDQRYKELAELRQKLEKKELDLSLREDEVKRDLDARSAREAASWKELAKFFEEGEPKDLAKNLASYDPRDAVKILRSLDDERASAIVNALPPEKYHEYLEAYRAQTTKEGGKK